MVLIIRGELSFVYFSIKIMGSNYNIRLFRSVLLNCSLCSLFTGDMLLQILSSFFLFGVTLAMPILRLSPEFHPNLNFLNG